VFQQDPTWPVVTVRRRIALAWHHGFGTSSAPPPGDNR
jgi:hypothetical protein